MSSEQKKSFTLVTKIPSERMDITWHVTDFYKIYPPGVPELQSFQIFSPKVSGGKTVGKQSDWNMSISGHHGFVSVLLNLTALAPCPLPNTTTPFIPSTVAGRLVLTLKNSKGEILQSNNLPKFTLNAGKENLRSCGWSNFVSFEKVWDDQRLVGNGLKFEATVYIYGEPVGETIGGTPEQSPNLKCNNLENCSRKQKSKVNDYDGHPILYSEIPSGNTNDVLFDHKDKLLEITCGTQTYKLNSSVLAAKSGYFADLLLGQTHSSLDRVELPAKTDGVIFGQVADFMYMGELPRDLEISNARKLLEAAEKYDVIDLAENVLKVLCRNIEPKDFQQISFWCWKFNGSQDIQNLLHQFAQKQAQ